MRIQPAVDEICGPQPARVSAQLVEKLAAAFKSGDRSLVEDGAFLLLDQARAAEGQPPADAAALPRGLSLVCFWERMG
mgnify:CR=1 FL=1